jgi:hypothetical protein
MFSSGSSIMIALESPLSCALIDYGKVTDYLEEDGVKLVSTFTDVSSTTADTLLSLFLNWFGATVTICDWLVLLKTGLYYFLFADVPLLCSLISEFIVELLGFGFSKFLLLPFCFAAGVFTAVGVIVAKLFLLPPLMKPFLGCF